MKTKRSEKASNRKMRNLSQKICVPSKKSRVDEAFPIELLPESIRNRPSGTSLTNAETLQVLRWAKARWDEAATEAGLR